MNDTAQTGPPIELDNAAYARICDRYADDVEKYGYQFLDSGLGTTLRKLAERLRATEKEVGRWQNAAVDAQSKLGEVQKYWDDEKRRYDAADKAFRLVCDERDSLASRLDDVTKKLEHADRALLEEIEWRQTAERRLEKALLLAEKISNTYGFAESWNPAELLKMSDNIIRECSPRVVENRRDLFSELKEGLESIPVETQRTIE